MSFPRLVAGERQWPCGWFGSRERLLHVQRLPNPFLSPQRKSNQLAVLLHKLSAPINARRPTPPHRSTPALSMSRAPPRSSDMAEVQKLYCYSSDLCIAMADPVRNPGGKVVFILDVGTFGWKNFDLMGAKMIFNMIQVSAAARATGGSISDELLQLQLMLWVGGPPLLPWLIGLVLA